MAILQWAMLCLELVQSLYGDYHFYDNFGAVFYDFGGDGYHAINGGSIEFEAENDCTWSDRGIAKYSLSDPCFVTLHNQVWNSPPNFLWNWQMTGWFFISSTEDLTILTRSCTTDQDPLFFEILHTCDGITVNAHMCTAASECMLYSGDFGITSVQTNNIWFCLHVELDLDKLALAVTINSGTPITIDFLINYLAVTLDGTCETILAPVYSGFVYEIAMGDLSESLDCMVSNSCGHCYFDLSDPICDCNDCPSSNDCISKCKSADFLADCETPNTCDGYQQVNGSCLSCTEPELSCMADGSTKDSLICSDGCDSCTGPTIEDCILTCPDHSVQQENECVCESGYFLDENGSCLLCDSSCVECVDSATFCTSCIELQILSGGVCSCPEHSELVDRVCTCSDGYYEACDETCSLNCQLCSSNCVTCSSETVCLSCGESEYLSESSTCESCEPLCASCGANAECVQCIDNALITGNSCECIENYSYEEGACLEIPLTATLSLETSDTVLLSFNRDIDTNITEEFLDLSIEDNPSFSWSLNVRSQSQSEINFAFNEDIHTHQLLVIRIVVPIEGRRLAEMVNTTLEIELEAYKALEESAVTETISKSVTSVTGGMISVSFFTANLGSVWSLLNTLDILRFVSLTKNPLSPALYALLGSINYDQSLTNVMSLILDDAGVQPYDEAYYFGFESNDFLINAGKFMSMLCVFLGLGMLLGLFGCLGLYRKFAWFRKIAGPFRFNIFTRFWIQGYLVIGVCAVLQLSDVINIQVNSSSAQAQVNWALSVVIMVGFFILPAVISLHALNNSQLLGLGGTPEFNERWGSLYEEFRVTSGVWPAQFYTLFLMRRLLFILNTMLMNSAPKVQAILNLLLALIVRVMQSALYLIIVRPYKQRFLQVLATYNELSIMSFYCIVPVFLYLDSADQREQAGNLAIFIVYLLLIVNIVSFAVKTALDLKAKCKKNEPLSEAGSDVHNKTSEADHELTKIGYRSKSHFIK